MVNLFKRPDYVDDSNVVKVQERKTFLFILLVLLGVILYLITMGSQTSMVVVDTTISSLGDYEELLAKHEGLRKDPSKHVTELVCPCTNPSAEILYNDFMTLAPSFDTLCHEDTFEKIEECRTDYYCRNNVYWNSFGQLTRRLCDQAIYSSDDAKSSFLDEDLLATHLMQENEFTAFSNGQFKKFRRSYEANFYQPLEASLILMSNEQLVSFLGVKPEYERNSELERNLDACVDGIKNDCASFENQAQSEYAAFDNAFPYRYLQCVKDKEGEKRMRVWHFRGSASDPFKNPAGEDKCDLVDVSSSFEPGRTNLYGTAEWDYTNSEQTRGRTRCMTSQESFDEGGTGKFYRLSCDEFEDDSTNPGWKSANKNILEVYGNEGDCENRQNEEKAIDMNDGCILNGATQVDFATEYVCKNNEVFMTVSGMGNLQSYPNTPNFNGLFSLPNPSWLIKPVINGVPMVANKCVSYTGFQLDNDPYPNEKFVSEGHQEQENSYFISCSDEDIASTGLKRVYFYHMRDTPNCNQCEERTAGNECSWTSNIGVNPTPESQAEIIPSFTLTEFHTGSVPGIMDSDAMNVFRSKNRAGVSVGMPWRGFQNREDSIWSLIANDADNGCDCYTDSYCEVTFEEGGEEGTNIPGGITCRCSLFRTMQSLSTAAFSTTAWVSGVPQSMAWDKTKNSDESFGNLIKMGLVDAWEFDSSFENYFNKCMPQGGDDDEVATCSYSEERNLSVLEIAFAFIAVSAGFFQYTRGFVDGICTPSETKVLKTYAEGKNARMSEFQSMKDRFSDVESAEKSAGQQIVPMALAPVPLAPVKL